MDQYANFAYCTLLSGITSADTVLTVDSTARVPDPATGEVWLAFDSTLADGEFEIVKVVSKDPTSLTVLRGQEGTVAPATTASGTVLRGTLTAAMLERLRSLSGVVLDSFAMRAPDDSIWDVTIDNSGAFVTTERT